jgi:ABC-type Fe3+-hydroxamate transport system substrate-binding protein
VITRPIGESRGRARTPLVRTPEPVRRLALAVALLLACRAQERAGDAGELRVISLSPSTTDIVVALGRRDALVGVDQFSHALPGMQDLPSLGGLFAPDLERAVELRPTLVLGVRSESQGAFFAQLRARGVRVHEIDSSGSLEEVLGTYVAIGAELGRDPEARALVARVREQLDVIARSVADRERPSVALVVEREPLYVAAGGSFASALIDAAGGRNVFADLPQPYPQVSLELLAERAPDVLIDSTQGTASGPDAERAARAHWSRFGWVRRVELVAPGVMTQPGAQLAEAARILRARIHPELDRTAAQ